MDFLLEVTVELEQLLYAPSLYSGQTGDTEIEQIRDFFRKGDWPEEHYFVLAIKKHLRTPAHKAMLEQHDISIEDMLNGRVAEQEARIAKDEIFRDWNAALGFRCFGA